MRLNEINGLQEYLKTIGEYEIYTPEKEQEMFKRLREGETGVRENIINSNLKLVVAVAKKYKGWSGLNFVDLIQEGSFGLMTAVDKFDYTLGFKFSTYAVHWIKQSITKAIMNKGRAIRLPAHITDKVSKVKKAEKELSQELGRDPSYEEIAKRLGMLQSEVKDIYEISLAAISLDTPVGDEEDSTLADFIEDTHFESPTAAIAKRDLREQIFKVMDSLEPREKTVLIKRYGLEENREPMTLEEIGQDLGLSRERIRQIEEKALRKMRNPIRSEQLKMYAADMVA